MRHRLRRERRLGLARGGDRPVEMQHTGLQAERADAEFDETPAASAAMMSGALDKSWRVSRTRWRSDIACARVSSPSLTARRSSSQDAICIRRVVSRMLSVA